MIKFLQRFDNLLLLLSPAVLILGAVVQLLVIQEMDALKLLPVFDQLVEPNHWLRSYWINLSLSPLLAFVVFLIFNRFILTDGFLPRLSNLPLFLASASYFLISSFHQHILVWITLFIFIQFLRNCFQVISNGVTRKNAFNSGFLLGLMMFTHPMLVVFGIVYIMATIFQGLPNIKTLLAFLIGLMTPFYFGAATFYLLGVPIPYFFSAVEWRVFNFSVVEPRQFVWIGILLATLVVIFSGRTMMLSATLKIKRKWNILFFSLVLAVICSLLFSSQLFAMFGLIPGCLLFAQFFQAPLRPRLHDSIAFLVLICILGAQVL